MNVVKRDSSVVPFDINKVIVAVHKAYLDTPGSSHFGDIPLKIGLIVQEEAIKFKELNGVDIDVELIQDIVEKELSKIDWNVAKNYIVYRYEHSVIRDRHESFVRDINNLVYLKDRNVINENANKDAKVFPVKRDLMAGIISKHMAKNHILPDEIVKAHEDGDIHFHDLDYSPFLPMSNCCLVDLKRLLQRGFKLGNAQIETPKSFGVACAVMAQITAQVASHQYGGTTFANVDKVLAPYALKSWNKHLARAKKYKIPDFQAYAEELTNKEIYDGIQGYEYEVNTLFTTNGQQPFVTLTFGTGVGRFEREIQKSILSVRIKGLGKDGITAVFPKLVMFVEDGINLKKGDINYDIKKLALECSSKRLYPDIISSRINREITGSAEPVSPMGCRSFLSVWKDSNGDFLLDGRNNIGVVSLNLPRIAIESKGDISSFYKILDKKLVLCRKALECRIDSLRGVKASVAPILYTEGAFGVNLEPDDDIFSLFSNGRASISLGYIGLHEVSMMMFNTSPLQSVESQEFLINVLNLMKDTVNAWKKETGFGYSLYSTPSESLCDRFCRLDKEKFGVIKGVTDKEWYTNSFHLDVKESATPFDKIDFESKYHWIASAGHITYCELPNMRDNLEALEQIWDYAVERLDYFGTNTPSDKCFVCGFEGEFTATSSGFHCPSCENKDSTKMNTIRRTCGYLGNPSSRGFNHGKQCEMVNRVKHM